MRAVVRVFLTLPTKSIWGNLTYKKLPVRKFFIYVQRIFSQTRAKVQECQGEDYIQSTI